MFRKLNEMKSMRL